MAAIFDSGPRLAVLANEQFLGEKMACAKFQLDISTTKRLVRVYTGSDMSKSIQLVTLLIIICVYIGI